MVVVTDRSLASGLVMQRHDGVDLEFLRALNARADRSDLAVILTADADTVAARLRERGAHNRYQLRRAETVREFELFVEASKVLRTTSVLTRVTPRISPPGTRQAKPRKGDEWTWLSADGLDAWRMKHGD
jgi:hypothetical protein